MIAWTPRLVTRVVAIVTLSALSLPSWSCASPQQDRPMLSLHRIDCGEFLLHDDSYLSDTFARAGVSRRLSVNCYLIQHGDDYMLWDAGLPGELAGGSFDTPEQTLALNETIVVQLARLRIRAGQISVLGLSHHHFDHLSQAGDFSDARLAMGAEDLAIIRAQHPQSRERQAIAPWLAGQRPLTEIVGDLDIFGDGSVIMLATPGHTPGHHSLLVRLASGPVLLSGDLYLTSEQAQASEVPAFNQDRAATLASMDRYDRISRNLNALSIIQHEPDHDRLLPVISGARRHDRRVGAGDVSRQT
jgi:N-acyl homoserine lactone hydrolase